MPEADSALGVPGALLYVMISSDVWASLAPEDSNRSLKSLSSVNYFSYLNDNYKECNKHEKVSKKNIFEAIY